MPAREEQSALCKAFRNTLIIRIAQSFLVYFFFERTSTRTPPLASMTALSSDVIMLERKESIERRPMFCCQSSLSFVNTLSPEFSATERNPPSSPSTLKPEWPSVRYITIPPGFRTVAIVSDNASQDPLLYVRSLPMTISAALSYSVASIRPHCRGTASTFSPALLRSIFRLAKLSTSGLASVAYTVCAPIFAIAMLVNPVPQPSSNTALSLNIDAFALFSSSRSRTSTIALFHTATPVLPAIPPAALVPCSTMILSPVDFRRNDLSSRFIHVC
mmetsp:Transcript_477/g.1139  ORF Transcript_477/g.1139 Transcript_477/m.1139 type:complete len:274 (+) Transcript_477:2781-3602(+)